MDKFISDMRRHTYNRRNGTDFPLFIKTAEDRMLGELLDAVEKEAGLKLNEDISMIKTARYNNTRLLDLLPFLGKRVGGGLLGTAFKDLLGVTAGLGTAGWTLGHLGSAMGNLAGQIPPGVWPWVGNAATYGLGAYGLKHLWDRTRGLRDRYGYSWMRTTPKDWWTAWRNNYNLKNYGDVLLNEQELVKWNEAVRKLKARPLDYSTRQKRKIEEGYKNFMQMYDADKAKFEVRNLANQIRADRKARDKAIKDYTPTYMNTFFGDTQDPNTLNNAKRMLPTEIGTAWKQTHPEATDRMKRFTELRTKIRGLPNNLKEDHRYFEW